MSGGMFSDGDQRGYIGLQIGLQMQGVHAVEAPNNPLRVSSLGEREHEPVECLNTVDLLLSFGAWLLRFCDVIVLVRLAQ